MNQNLSIDRLTLETDSQTSVSYYVGGEKQGKPVVLLHGGGTDHALLS